MTNFNLIASPGILGLRSSRKTVKWSYGVAIPSGSAEELDNCSVVIEVEVVPELEPAEASSDMGKYHYFSGRHGADRIRYERTFLGNQKIQFEASGLVQGTPKFRFNEAYWNRVRFRFMNVHSAGYILTDIASLLLLRNDFAPLHCSGFRKGESGVVVIAPPNTGKTLTTMQACMSLGGEYLAEDLAITDGQTLHAVPWTSTFRYYGEVESSKGARLRNKLTEIFPPVELIPSRKPQSIDGYVEQSKMLSSAEITHLVILERGEEAIVPISVDEAVQKAVNLNRYEFNYPKAPTAVAYEFFNPELDLDGASRNERRIIRNMIENAQEVLVVRNSDPVAYAGMIWAHLP